MNYRRSPFPLLFVTASLLTTTGLYYASSAVIAQEKQTSTQTSNTEATKTPAGFVTGTKCAKTGTYRAENKYLQLVITLEEGDEFPPFPDGQKATWYPLTASSTTSFEPVKVAPATN